jgi:hypothetical protein
VIFDIVGAGLLLSGAIALAVADVVDDQSTLAMGATITGLGGALLLGSIPAMVLWPGSAERVPLAGTLAVDGIGAWFARPSVDGRTAPAAGLALRARWAGW